MLARGFSIEEIAQLLRRDHADIRDKVVEVGRACRYRGSAADLRTDPALFDRYGTFSARNPRRSSEKPMVSRADRRPGPPWLRASRVGDLGSAGGRMLVLRLRLEIAGVGGRYERSLRS
jgi:hypothetical protein